MVMIDGIKGTVIKLGIRRTIIIVMELYIPNCKITKVYNSNMLHFEFNYFSYMYIH